MFLDGIAYKVLGTRDYAKLFLWVPKVMLNIVMLWPRTKYFKIKSFISTSISFSLMVFIVVGLVQDMEFSIENMDKVMFNLAFTVNAFQASAKSIIIFYKASELKSILDDINTKFWPHNLTGGDLKNQLKFFYLLIMIIMLTLPIMGICFGIGFWLPPLFGHNRELPFSVKYSFDWKRSPIYELMYISHILGNQWTMVYCILGVDCLFISIVASAVTQYRILQKCFSLYNTTEMTEVNTKLKTINKEDCKRYKDDRKDFFVTCLQHHQLLLRFTKKINNLFGLALLIQLLSSTFGICLGIFVITRDGWTIPQLFLSAIFAFGHSHELMLYCIVGNELNYQASLLPDHIYKSNWRNLEDKTLQKDVMLVIQNSQTTVQLTAYGLYDINMNSYVKVVKLAFSIYTLLSAMSSK